MTAGESRLEILPKIDCRRWVKIGRRWWVKIQCRFTRDFPILLQITFCWHVTENIFPHSHISRRKLSERGIVDVEVFIWEGRNSYLDSPLETRQ